MDKSFKIKLGKDVYTDADLDVIFELAQSALAETPNGSFGVLLGKISSQKHLKILKAKLDRTLA